MTDEQQIAYLESLRQEAVNIRQVAIKNRIWTVSIIIISAVIVTLIFFLNLPKDNSKELRAMESQIKEYKEKDVSSQQMINQLNANITKLSNEDSVLIGVGLTNRAYILKIKPGVHERIKVFDNYGNSDWAKYYSELPEPQR